MKRIVIKKVLIIFVVSCVSFFVFISKLDLDKNISNLDLNYEANVSSILKEDKVKSKAYVTKVIDGDSFVVNGGREIRLIGVDAPEFSQPYSLDSKNYLENLILNREVLLEKDKTNEDRYGRLLRYVYLGDEFINEKIVRNGYANIYSYPPNITYENLFIKAEKLAKNEELGFWSLNLKK
jgi:endonuclease YncB( thermonuclease family)